MKDFIDDHIDSYQSRLAELLDGLNPRAIELVANTLKRRARSCGIPVILIGNGGSAATAAHWANDLVACGIDARALTDAPTLSAIGNDFGYDQVFVRQLRNMLSPYILIAISVSGKSPNVIEAVKHARLAGGGAVVIGLTGFDGGELNKLCDTVIHVPSAPGEYGLTEDIHMIMDHVITGWLKTQT